MKNRKVLSILLAVFVLTIFSCENWMKDDNLYSDIEYDVKVANASKIQVFTRYAMTSQGSTSPSGYSTFKVGIPHEISATTDTNYGFVRWAAFSTTYLDTIDQQKNENVIYNSVTEYEENILPNEITAPNVVFENPESPSTKVTVNQARGDIFIVPLVTARPKVNGTIPDDRETEVVRNSAVRINFTKEMDYDTLKNGISITQGSWVEREDGLYYDYEDISNRFGDPRISNNKKLITFSFAPQYIKSGFDQSAKVTVTISKDVKDVFGFSMVEDEKFVFTPGGTIDSRAPRITQLTGGWKTKFGDFEGIYAYSGTAETLGGKTKFVIKGTGSEDAPTSLNSIFYNSNFGNPAIQSFVENRVGNKVSLRVFAEDLSKDEAINVVNQEKDEKGVKWVWIRARLLFNNDGTYDLGNYTTSTEKVYSQKGNPAKIGTTSQGTPTYETLVTAAGFTEDDAKNVGCLFEYDLNNLDDGLIQIDVAAVDSVGNNGFDEHEAISKVNGNGYASIFVVKDTKAPVGVNDNSIDVKLKATGTENEQTVSWSNYYNGSDFEKLEFSLKDSAVQNNIYDLGNDKLRSKKSNIKWTIIPIADDVTDDVAEELLAAPEVSWKALSDSFTGFTAPTQDNANGQKFAYGIKDDMDNINAIILGKTIKYDCTAPEIGELTWTADAGVVAGISTGTVLSNQMLEIPVSDGTSSIKAFEILVKHVNENGEEDDAYATPFASTSDLKIYKNDTKTQFETIEYICSGTKITLNGTYSDIEKIIIKGIKIAETAVEGNYKVYVKAYDNAGNVTLSNPIDLSNDSTAPVIEKIVIPGLKKAVNYSNNSVLYWTPSRVTTTNVYIYFTETNSGATIFDFAGSTIKLTSSSQVCIDSDSPLTINEYTKDTTGNKLTFKTPIRGTSKKLTITNVQLDTTSTGSKVNLVITDLATKGSSKATTVQNDTPAPDTLTGITSFFYENDNPVINSVTLTGNADAVSGYTNTTSITANLSVTAKESGVQIIKVSDNAKFDSTTIVKVGSTIIPATVSADGTTLTLDSDKIARDVSSAFTITLSNVKITSGDGTKTVTFAVKTMAERESESKSVSIELDTVKPVWNNKGLYSGATSASYYSYIYPRPVSNEKVWGIDFGEYNNVAGNEQARKILYFYDGSSYIRIFADVTDANLTSNYYWKHDGDTSVTPGPYQDNSSKWVGHNQVYAMDKAGNKSDIIDYYCVRVSSLITSDASRKDIKTNLENEVELLIPEGADLQKNTFLNGVRSPEGPRNSSSFDYYNGSQTSKIYVFNYILRQFDGKNYKLKVPVHTYASADKNTVPIEQYGVSHQYTEFPSTSEDCAEDPFTPRTPNWHDYKVNTSSITDGHLSSRVDENGDIIITLPNDHNCPPVSLWLKDACGNTEYILLNPGLKDKLGTLTVCETRPGTTKQGKRNQAVAYVIDNRIGVNDSHNGTGSNEEKTYPTNTLVSRSDISFYKKNSSNELPGLKLKELSDSCRFPYVSNYNGLADLENNPSDYTLKSKIIVWQGTGIPAYEKFYDSNISGSSWYAWKEFYDAAGAGSAFSLENNFPEFDTTTHDTDKYELWYIIEDRVGNYEVRQLTYGSNSYWLYDVTPPKLDVKQATNVNNIDGKNYYSNSSSVKYSIEDKQSGIQHNGASAYDYSSFASRVQLYPENGLTDYPLSGKTPDSNGKISIENVKDWAENIATSVGLENGGSNIWVKQTSAPSFSTTPLDIVAPNHGTHRFNVSEQNGKYTIDASYNIIKIELKFYINDSEKLLGWVIKDNDTAPDSDKFYTISDVEQIPYSNATYTYTFNKTNNGQPDNSTIWSDFVHDKDMYFYPVNRAGMINTTPVIIHFKKNVVPALNGSLSYSNIVKYPASGTATTNYTKTGSKVKFTTINNPTQCRIIYGSGSSDYVEFTLSTTTQQYEIPLDSLQSIKNATLKLVLIGSEISKEYDLNGPAGVNSWTYDETAPTISISSIKSDESTAAVSYNGVEYLLGENAIITFNTSDEDIAKFEWKVGSATNFTTINSSNPAATTYTFTAPENETTYVFRATDKAGNVSETISKKLKKDAAAPAGTLSYKMKYGDSDATTGYTNEAADENNASSRLIKYTPGLVNKIYFDFSGITDAGSGIKRFNVKTGTSNDYITDGTAYTLSLGNNWTEKVYEIIAEDNVGNTRTLNTFTFTADSSAPGITIDSVISQGSSKTYPAVQIGDIWYLNRNKAKVTINSTATDIDHYEWDEGNGNTEANFKTITLTSGAYTITNVPETTKTYYFRAVDKVGNKGQTVPVKVIYDSASPYIEDSAPVTYSPMLDNSQATAGFSESGTGTITFTYNPSYVNKLIFDFTGVKDDCSGIKKIVYKVNDVENQITLDSNNKGTILLAGPLNATYEFIAYDKVDRTKSLATYTFVADSTPPSVSEKNGSTTYWVLNDNVKKLQKYSIVGNTSLITVMDSQIGENYLSNCYKGTLQISYPASVISGAVKYKYIITPAQTSDADGQRGYVSTKPNAGDSGWEDLTTSNGSYVFTIPEVTVPHTHIGVFFKDAVENVSEVYYFGNKDHYEYQWWLVEKDITADNISISPSAAFSAETTEYTLTVELPQGTILHKVETTNGTVDSVAFSSYTAGTFSWNGSDKGNDSGYVYIPTMTVKLKNVNSNEVKLKINGVEKAVFNAGNGGNANIVSGIFTGVSTVIDQIQNTSVDNVFGSSSGYYTYSTPSSIGAVSSATGPALAGISASAKTKKNIAKTAKATAKATVKPTKQTPVVQEIAAQVEEIAEITEIAELATPVAKDQLAMVLPKTANTKQIETQVSVETSLVETTSDTYEETVHDDLVFKLIVAIASLVLCGVFGLTMLLKRKRA